METIKYYPGQVSNPYLGKVRRISDVGGGILVAETTNQISAFDQVLPVNVPHKGAVLNLTTAFYMQETKDIIPNCLLDVPHPRASTWIKTKPFEFEVIVRGYNAVKSSFYRNYVSSGKQNPWGYDLPSGLRGNEKFPYLLVTPTTKAVRGHDEDISAIEIVSHGWATMEQWDYIEEKVIMLFRRGWEIANKWGIILVDTKYEFGQDEAGKIYLIDEIHTPDSSRYWHKDTYEDSLKNGEEPKALSKEFVRQWLIERGFQGRKGDIMPFFPQDFIHSITDRYMEFYTKMGLPLSALESDDDSTLYESVCQSLEKFR